MGMKFLNKKGWHTGSLRNIENVWKAEQKHDAEQKKLEELRKQIHEERERSEFRLLQEQAGLIPKQERLDFLYESGLAVGKASASDGFKSLETPHPPDPPPSTSTQQQPSVPGALFEVKPQSANDAWRKLHSDPLLLIRQREQEAVARVKNNPVQMAMIRKSVEAKKQKETASEGKEHGKQRKKSKHKSRNAERERDTTSNHERTKYNDHLNKASSDSEKESSKGTQRRSKSYRESKYESEITTAKSDDRRGVDGKYDKSLPPKYDEKGSVDSKYARRDREVRSETKHHSSDRESRHDSHSRHRKNAVKLSEEERAARLREMQVNAELHEEQRWKRLKKAEEDDAREVTQASTSGNKNFLDAVTRSVYGADKGGSSTIEESVRRRMHYSQGRSQVEGNAFRR